MQDRLERFAQRDVFEVDVFDDTRGDLFALEILLVPTAGLATLRLGQIREPTALAAALLPAGGRSSLLLCAGWRLAGKRSRHRALGARDDAVIDDDVDLVGAGNEVQNVPEVDVLEDDADWVLQHFVDPRADTLFLDPLVHARHIDPRIFDAARVGALGERLHALDVFADLLDLLVDFFLALDHAFAVEAHRRIVQAALGAFVVRSDQQHLLEMVLRFLVELVFEVLLAERDQLPYPLNFELVSGKLWRFARLTQRRGIEGLERRPRGRIDAGRADVELGLRIVAVALGVFKIRIECEGAIELIERLTVVALFVQRDAQAEVLSRFGDDGLALRRREFLDRK